MAHNAMWPEWDMMQTLLDGTDAMRAAGEAYLPRHESEGETRYAERLAGNVLFNVTDLTLRTWVGKPFSSAVQYTDDFAPHLKPFIGDIDLQGNNVDVFAREWFANGVSHSLSHVMVDFPRVNFFPGRTLKDDANENVRPYCVQIAPENVIFASSERIDGVDTLTHVRIREWDVQRVDWEEVVTERIKVYDREWVFPDEETNALTEAQVFVKVTTWDYDTEKTEWVDRGFFYMDIDFIPLVTFYSNKTGFMTGKSPLLDLAHLNVRHWQSNSDQIAILTVARFPLLACSGGNSEETQVVVGPNEFLFVDDPSGKWYYVEHKGAAIEAGDRELTKLEQQMMAYGSEFMKKKPDRQTASARNLDSSEATSPLQDVVTRFTDSLNRMFWIMSYWMDRVEDHEGKAFVRTDFTDPDSASLQTLYNTWKEGGIGNKEYLHELQRRSVLDEHFDFEKNDRSAKKTETVE